jgi:hypothetical protein
VEQQVEHRVDAEHRQSIALLAAHAAQLVDGEGVEIPQGQRR